MRDRLFSVGLSLVLLLVMLSPLVALGLVLVLADFPPSLVLVLCGVPALIGIVGLGFLVPTREGIALSAILSVIMLVLLALAPTLTRHMDSHWNNVMKDHT